MAPSGTPVEIVERLNREINRGLANPAIKAQFADWGLVTMPGSPEDFGKFFAQEIAKWRKVVSFSGAKGE
jgi:tripartite-type tricarboxylate transporter receptor subunit TctC